jgi:hypothetical protein
MMTERILTRRDLNRAALARQFLLEPAALAPLAALRHLIALQGQVSNAPYIGLWTRLRAFQRADLTDLLENRQVVRASSLRGTLHLLAAEDYVAIHPILQPALSRNLQLFARRSADFDIEQFAAQMRAYLREQPRTASEMRAQMETLYPGMGRPQIVDAVRMHLALIQLPPAGTWGFTGKPRHAEAAIWLGRSLTVPESGARALVLRYLAAFGPASVQDMQVWSGLTRLQGIIDALKPELCAFRDERGRELFDLPDAPRPPADCIAPPRFLPEYDNLLLAYADRRRVMADAYYPRVFSVNGGVRGTILVDGFVAGAWKIARLREARRLLIEPFAPLAEPERAALLAEAKRLLRWIADDAQPFAISIAPWQ